MVKVSGVAAIPLIMFAVLPGRVHAQTSAGALTNADVIRLLGLGVSDRTVLSVIQEAKQRQFDTAADSITTLKASGVSEAVIAAIQRAPAAAAVDDFGLDRQKFAGVWEAGRALRRGLASANATMGQLDRQLQTFKTELSGARSNATTQGERSLVTKYTLAQLQFEAGLNQANAPQRLDAWANAMAALDDADKIYLTK